MYEARFRVVPGLLALTAALAGGSSTECSEFKSRRTCGAVLGNLVGEVRNITGGEGGCQDYCRNTTDCNYFNYIRFEGVTSYANCYLFSACEPYDECTGSCVHSILGPPLPKYPEVCCPEFSSGRGCSLTASSLVGVQPGVETPQMCQQVCQAMEQCQYFFHEASLSKCFLLAFCDDQVPCVACLSGPVFPDMAECTPTPTTAPPPTTTAPPPTTLGPLVNMTVLLLGGFGGITDVNFAVESYPCDKNIQDVPYSFFGAGTAVLAGKPYLCGGYEWRRSGNKKQFADCYLLLENGTWEPSAPMLIGKELFAMNAVGDAIYAIGGYSRNERLETVEIFRNDEWTFANWTLPEPRYVTCSVTISDEEVLLLGGNNNTIDRVNVKTGVLTKLSDIPGQYSFACTIMDQETVALAGGLLENHQDTTNRVQTFNIRTGEWCDLPNLQRQRFQHTLANINGKLAVFGGVGPSQPNDSMEVLENGEWTDSYLRKGGRDQHSQLLIPC